MAKSREARGAKAGWARSEGQGWKIPVASPPARHCLWLSTVGKTQLQRAQLAGKVFSPTIKILCEVWKCAVSCCFSCCFDSTGSQVMLVPKKIVRVLMVVAHVPRSLLSHLICGSKPRRPRFSLRFPPEGDDAGVGDREKREVDRSFPD